MTGEIFINGTKIADVVDFKVDWNSIITKGFVDKEIFGKQSQTYYTPISISPHYPPFRVVKPKEVGISIPGLNSLALNGCVEEKKWSFITYLAHAHICICKSCDFKGMVCIPEEYLKNSDGTYSDILLHEVAHLLTDYSPYLKPIAKPFGGDVHKAIASLGPLPSNSSWAHGEEWGKWMRKFGIPESKYTSTPY